MNGLEALDGIKYCSEMLKDNHRIGNRDSANQEIKEMVDRLNYRIPIIEKELKALEIIKKKQVNLRYFSVGDLVLYNSLEHTIELTQEEFTLLKEVLGNE